MSWTTLRPLNQARVGHTATLVNYNDNYAIFVAGGVESAIGEAIAKCEMVLLPKGGSEELKATEKAQEKARAKERKKDKDKSAKRAQTRRDDMAPIQATAYPAFPLNERRGYHTASLLMNGNVLLTGGTSKESAANSSDALRSCEILQLFPNTIPAPERANTTTASSTNAQLTNLNLQFEVKLVKSAPMKVPRTRHAACVLQDGCVLVCGGLTSDNSVVTECEIYVPEEDKWYPCAPLEKGMFGHTLTLLADGRVLLVGGEIRKSRDISNTSLAFIYNPARDEWDTVGGGGGAKGGLTRHKTHLMGDGGVAVIPGSDFWCTYIDNKSQNHRIDVKSVNIPKSSIVDVGWTNASCGSSVNFYGDTLVNFGGFTSRGPTRDCSVLDYNLALRNAKEAEWRKLTEEDAMPDNPSDFTATRIDHCRAVIIGGFAPSNSDRVQASNSNAFIYTVNTVYLFDYNQTKIAKKGAKITKLLDSKPADGLRTNPLSDARFTVAVPKEAHDRRKDLIVVSPRVKEEGKKEEKKEGMKEEKKEEKAEAKTLATSKELKKSKDDEKRRRLEEERKQKEEEEWRKAQSKKEGKRPKEDKKVEKVKEKADKAEKEAKEKAEKEEKKKEEKERKEQIDSMKRTKSKEKLDYKEKRNKSEPLPIEKADRTVSIAVDNDPPPTRAPPERASDDLAKPKEDQVNNERKQTTLKRISSQKFGDLVQSGLIDAAPSSPRSQAVQLANDDVDEKYRGGRYDLSSSSSSSEEIALLADILAPTKSAAKGDAKSVSTVTTTRKQGHDGSTTTATSTVTLSDPDNTREREDFARMISDLDNMGTVNRINTMKLQQQQVQQAQQQNLIMQQQQQLIMMQHQNQHLANQLVLQSSENLSPRSETRNTRVIRVPTMNTTNSVHSNAPVSPHRNALVHSTPSLSAPTSQSLANHASSDSDMEHLLKLERAKRVIATTVSTILNRLQMAVAIIDSITAIPTLLRIVLCFQNIKQELLTNSSVVSMSAQNVSPGTGTCGAQVLAKLVRMEYSTLTSLFQEVILQSGGLNATQQVTVILQSLVRIQALLDKEKL